jgi:hypothetical protein
VSYTANVVVLQLDDAEEHCLVIVLVLSRPIEGGSHTLCEQLAADELDSVFKCSFVSHNILDLSFPVSKDIEKISKVSFFEHKKILKRKKYFRISLKRRIFAFQKIVIH